MSNHAKAIFEADDSKMQSVMDGMDKKLEHLEHRFHRFGEVAEKALELTGITLLLEHEIGRASCRERVCYPV